MADVPSVLRWGVCCRSRPFLWHPLQYGLTLRNRSNRPRTTNSGHNLPKYPDLTAKLLVERPNQLWVSDITYIVIWTDNEHYIFCYLSLITDAYTKEIIGYCVGDTLESIYTVKALEMAMERLKDNPVTGLIHHSDRGVQYMQASNTSHAWSRSRYRWAWQRRGIRRIMRWPRE